MHSSRERLAAVVSKCFSTAMPATKDILRHAVYAQFIGREIRSSQDLEDAEVERMLTEWEDYQSPFLPSQKAIIECNALSKEYQQAHGQAEMNFESTN